MGVNSQLAILQLCAEMLLCSNLTGVLETGTCYKHT